MRLFDFLISFVLLVFLSPLLFVLYLLGLIDTGSPVFSQERVGKNQKTFTLYKFRTMQIGTKSKGTHLIDKSSVTRIGRFLRKTKLDELPQLFNVLMGDMSLVGPRPNLPNQIELINERSKKGVYDYLPGITGLAQIQGIDMSTPERLAEKDAEMLSSLNLTKYCEFLLKTFLGKGQGDRVKY